MKFYNISRNQVEEVETNCFIAAVAFIATFLLSMLLFDFSVLTPLNVATIFALFLVGMCGIGRVVFILHGIR